MKALLFPLVIAMVITFAFGHFSNEPGYSDLVLFSVAIFAAVAAKVFRQKEQNQYRDLQPQRMVSAPFLMETLVKPF